MHLYTAAGNVTTRRTEPHYIASELVIVLGKYCNVILFEVDNLTKVAFRDITFWLRSLAAVNNSHGSIGSFTKFTPSKFYTDCPLLRILCA
jgi:hypothetical protein